MAQQNSLSTSETKESFFRSIIRGKTRIALAWIFALLLVLSARDFPTLPGVSVCFLGATLRYWASGFLRKDNRPAVGGPYAFVRNPLYLGTYLMAIGTALAIHAWILLAASTVLFAIIYHYIILDEEIKLQGIFGAPYAKYCAAVPRFFPRLFPPMTPAPRTTLVEINPDESHLKFSSELATKNKAYEAYVSFLGLMGFVSLLAWGWKLLGY